MGGSAGPHLHFARQETTLQNPLKYGFKEIQDDVAPAEVVAVAFKR